MSKRMLGTQLSNYSTAANHKFQVRIRCADSGCTDYDLCVSCFSKGSSNKNHDPRTHSFQVIEQHSIPIFANDWGADEELLLLEGAETYGLGSWADIADHIGGFRTKDEVAKHYTEVYINSTKFPLPELASPNVSGGLDKISREDFQARKKRRIETRKEAQKNAPPAAPKKKPTASVPSCHEVQGYMPGRMEFETEYMNEAEEAVMHMQFEPGDGINPHTGQLDPEMELKMAVMDIYNSRLTERVKRKKIMFQHDLLEYRKNTALDKKRTKEEKDQINKAKPFARMQRKNDFQSFSDGIISELNYRQAISQLQDWRNMQIADLRSGEKYEGEKSQRVRYFKFNPSYNSRQITHLNNYNMRDRPQHDSETDAVLEGMAGSAEDLVYPLNRYRFERAGIYEVVPTTGRFTHPLDEHFDGEGVSLQEDTPVTGSSYPIGENSSTRQWVTHNTQDIGGHPCPYQSCPRHARPFFRPQALSLHVRRYHEIGHISIPDEDVVADGFVLSYSSANQRVVQDALDNCCYPCPHLDCPKFTHHFKFPHSLSDHMLIEHWIPSRGDSPICEEVSLQGILTIFLNSSKLRNQSQWVNSTV
jgi:Myb-like DNA-binding domain/Zinc finger, ZZ type